MPRYIDAEALSKEFHRLKLGEHSLIERLFADGVYAVIDTFPTADVQEVVRCKDCKYCKHWYADKGLCYLWHETGIDVFENGFCSYGKKMDGEKEKEE